MCDCVQREGNSAIVRRERATARVCPYNVRSEAIGARVRHERAAARARPYNVRCVTEFIVSVRRFNLCKIYRPSSFLDC
jgi:hypothetical protein